MEGSELAKRKDGIQGFVADVRKIIDEARANAPCAA